MKELKRVDRRTRYTINVIKESFLKLIDQLPYSKVTITQLCKEADLTRSTFYLHFNSLTDLLNEVIDDALYLSGEGNSLELQSSANYLQDNGSLLPVCQRIGNSPKYQKLLMDPDLSEYIIGRIMQHEQQYVIPSIIKKTGLNSDAAESLFRYVIHGSFAVNRAHRFIKSDAWMRDMKMLNDFTEAGYQRLKKNSSTKLNIK